MDVSPPLKPKMTSPSLESLETRRKEETIPFGEGERLIGSLVGSTELSRFRADILVEQKG